jgi:hypothetical protein
MKHLVGKVITKKVPFMGDEVEVRKMSVSEVMQIQELVKKANKSKAEDSQLGLLRDVIRLAVIGADEITDEDFNTFPIGELSELSNEILGFSGLGEAAAGN